MEHWQAHLDEIKCLRDEINWRVRIAYTASAIFIAVFTATIGILLNQNNYKYNSDNFLIITLVFMVVLAVFIGILVSNHIIVKRIELYCLQLQKTIYKEANEPIYNWLSFLYGYKSIKKNKMFLIVEKFFAGSIGLFQYGIPNLFCLGLLVSLQMKMSAFSRFPILYSVVSIIFTISFFSSLYLLYFVSIVHKEHKKFYCKNVEKFLNKGNFIIN